MLPPYEFTDDGKTALVYAARESSDAGHSETWTTDLLIGILRSQGQPGAKVLARAQVELAAVRDEVPLAPPGSNEPEFHTPRPSQISIALEAAHREAVRSGTSGINTIHLLLGLLQATDGVAARILGDHGVGEEEIRRGAD